MRATDLTSKHKTRPVVYVDMDGVLADFFGEIAREHEVEYWREIHRQDIGIDQVARVPGFFENLPLMPHAAQLMMGVLSLCNNYSILSSPLLSDVDGSAEGKAEWLNKHLDQHPPESITFDHEKYRYAKQANGTPNILIDDFETNIKLWESHGGIGILHVDKDWKETVKQLAKALGGYVTPSQLDLAVSENTDDIPENPQIGKLFTCRQVLKYVNGIHNEYHLEKPILKYKFWVLREVPLSNLKNPEFVHQDDPYRRVIDLDWDHIKDITVKDIIRKPVVADENGWLLDGNHRATAARAAGLPAIPVLIPYTK